MICKICGEHFISLDGTDICIPCQVGKKKQTIYFIGTDGETTVNSQETQRQIDEVKKLESVLIDEGTKEVLPWLAFDDPKEPRSLFQSILNDRRMRVDEGTIMADRPSFIVVTAHRGQTIRLEFYEGHDSLSLVYDLRSRELQGKKLPAYMESDPCGYDPIAFLSKHFPEIMKSPEEIKRVLDEAHRKEREEA
jgi:hypothetical protein